MIAFDFLYDPRVALLERVRAFRLSAVLATACIALATAILVVGSAWIVERQRLVDALGEVGALHVQYGALRERLIRERLEAGEVADLGTLDGKLRDIAASGSRVRERLAALAGLVPTDVWLVSVNDDGGNLVLVGRSASLSGIARALARFGTSRFGSASLSGVTRIERPGGALLEFSATLSGH